MPFVYNAELWCHSCGLKIREDLRAEGQGDTGDSEDFPQWVNSPGGSDSPSHCPSEDQCVEAMDLCAWGLAEDAPLYGAESRYIGELVSGDMTTEGEDYVREMLAEPNPTPYQTALHRVWEEMLL